MKIKKCTRYAVLIVSFLLIQSGRAESGDMFFQPRLEAGVMFYSFESEAVSVASLSKELPINSGYNYTQQAFEYNDSMLFMGVGGTLVVNRFYLDFSGQFAKDGQDSAVVPYSGYNTIEFDPENMYMETGFLAAEPDHDVGFERSDMAISMGYMFNNKLSMFIGYKWAKTEFDATYRGPFSFIQYTADGSHDAIGGWISGEVAFKFGYEGPFVGAIQGWDFGQDYLLEGSLGVSVALAYLESDVELERRKSKMTVDWMNGEPIPEHEFQLESGGISNRYDTKGESLGLTFGLGWRGATQIEGLSYTLGFSGYRYEFEAQENEQSNVNENVFILKCGLSYAF